MRFASELSLSISTVRRAIAKLKTLWTNSDRKLSAKTHYQANWYTVDKETVKLFLNEHIDMFRTEVSICSKQIDHFKDFSSKDFPTQQHTAVELEKNEEVEEVDWELLAKKTEIWEQNQTTHFVDEVKLVYSINDSDLGEGNSSAAVEVVEKSNQAVLTNSVQVTRFIDEPELVDSTDEGNYCAAEYAEKSSQPSHEEVQDVLQQCGIPCMGLSAFPKV